jgi:hypothetical protein
MLGKRVDVVVGVDLNVVAWQRCLMTMMYELGDVDLVMSEVCMGPWRLDMPWSCDSTSVVAWRR